LQVNVPDGHTIDKYPSFVVMLRKLAQIDSGRHEPRSAIQGNHTQSVVEQEKPQYVGENNSNCREDTEEQRGEEGKLKYREQEVKENTPQVRG
jgi:hypothetical protein